MRNLLLAGLIVSNVIALAQKIEPESKTYMPTTKRFIDKVEVFGGPSLSFNRGNMFIENYSDPIIQNKRLMKAGYSIGIGAYHPVKNWLDLNARVLFEHKGTRSQLNNPLNPVNDDSRLVTNSEYSYGYLTVCLTSNLFIGKRKNVSVLFGGYLSKIKSVRGFGSNFDTQGHITPTAGNFVGRYWYGFREDGAINSFTFIPGLQSFEENDFGLSIGMAYQIHIHGNHSLTVRLIDNYGLHNIYNKKFVENLPEKNHNLSLTLGYMFSRYEKELREIN